MMNNNKWLQYEVTYPHEMMLEWFLRIASNEQVKEQGDIAAIQYAKQFDQAQATQISDLNTTKNVIPPSKLLI